MEDFKGQKLVDFHSVVPITFEMTAHDGFQVPAFDIWPEKASRVEQHLLNIPGKGITIPNPEMENLVPSKEKTF